MHSNALQIAHCILVNVLKLRGTIPLNLFSKVNALADKGTDEGQETNFLCTKTLCYCTEAHCTKSK